MHVRNSALQTITVEQNGGYRRRKALNDLRNVTERSWQKTRSVWDLTVTIRRVGGVVLGLAVKRD